MGFSIWSYVSCPKIFLKLTNFIWLYHHFGEISRIFKKNDLSLGGSLTKWSWSTSNFFSFFETSKTYLYPPQVVLWYANYSRSNNSIRLIFQKCYQLFPFFLIVVKFFIFCLFSFWLIAPRKLIWYLSKNAQKHSKWF